MLVAMIVYLSIGAFVVFGLAREVMFELVKEVSLPMKIFWLSICVLGAPVLFAYGFVKGALEQ